jgi:glyoxylase-like metal-dependent hydrolase (beta-lactamase superfamily II)
MQAGQRQPPPLNPATARNTDSCLPLRGAGPVVHNYEVDGPAAGNLWFRWAHGSIVAAKNQDPRVQVMRYNDDTFVMRENICVDWRGPFTYLLFGNEKALLIDTGATSEPAWYPLRKTVEGVMGQWETNRGRPGTPLTIAFTSAESRAQNGGVEQFAGRAKTSVDPRTVDAMRRFYGFEGGPQGTGQIDLGGRVVDVIPTPGTHRDGVSFYDRYTKLLFTGDLLFPGKIQIANERDTVDSLARLQQWKERHIVKWVMGGHVQMQFLPGRAYDRFATFKPYERALQMQPEVIDDALRTAQEIVGKRTVLVRPDFWMLNGVGPDQDPETFPGDLPNLRGPRPV